jgi:hypothetical protein
MKRLYLALCFLARASAGDPTPPGPAPALILPDGEGVLDLAAVQQAATFDAIPNPFRIRDRPPPPVREIPLVVSCVLVPGRPEDAAAVINGRLCSPGDLCEGLRVSRIGAETLELRGNDCVLRVPVQDRPARLRLVP